MEKQTILASYGKYDETMWKQAVGIHHYLNQSLNLMKFMVTSENGPVDKHILYNWIKVQDMNFSGMGR